MVSSPSEAEEAVAFMCYPPQGLRGVALFHRAAGFGQHFDEHFKESNEQLVTVVQIETPMAVNQIDAIAAVQGVDVLFVGPLDLSVNLGIPKQFDHPEFIEALHTVVNAAKRHGKAAGIMASSADHLETFINLGFTFLACGSDGGAVSCGLKKIADTFNQYR